ncbi:MAG: hypothetical protein R3B47_14135 [Bacteroidia bacterium]
MEKAAELQFRLCGIDQEYYPAFLYMTAQWLESGGDEMKSLEQRAGRACAAFRKHLSTDMEEDDYQLFHKILADTSISIFLDQIAGIPRLKQAAEDLRTSWEIYAFREEKDYYSNNLRRSAYMKQQFSSYYNEASLHDSLPRFFVKTGGMHAGIGESRLHIHDLGNML